HNTRPGAAVHVAVAVLDLEEAVVERRKSLEMRVRHALLPSVRRARSEPHVCSTRAARRFARFGISTRAGSAFRAACLLPRSEVMASQHWDVVVIGSGLGGLACAAYLAAAGRRTLVLESHYVAGGNSQVLRRRHNGRASRFALA